MNENLKWYGGAVAVVGLTVGAIYYFDQRRENRSYRSTNLPLPQQLRSLSCPRSPPSGIRCPRQNLKKHSRNSMIAMRRCRTR